MFRIGFRTAGFYRQSLRETLLDLGRLGYDGVEMCLEHPDCRPETLTAKRCEEIARFCFDAALEVASVSYHADNEPADQRRENSIRAIELVPAFGTDIFIINGRRVVPGQEEEVRTDLERLLEVLLLRGAELGVRVAVEPEPGLAVADTQEMKALLDRIESPNLGVNLDVGHAFLTDTDVCASIELLGDSILHTHFEGMPSGEHRHLLPGEGDMDLPAVCRVLRGIGYKGYVTIDLFQIADNPVAWANRALQAMRKVLREPETDP